VATTNSGRSRHPSPWLVSAAALVAAAFLWRADPDPGSAGAVRVPSSTIEQPTPRPRPTSIAAPTSEPRISAESIERAMSGDAGPRDVILERMLARWVAVDAPAAARFAELQEDPFLREVALRTAALRWARIDGEAAARWAVALGDTAERDALIDAVALTMADSDPRAALELLTARSVDARTDSTRAGVVTSWASRDFAAAQAWVEAQPPGASRDDIVLRLAFLQAHTDPPAAMRFASAMLADETLRRDAYASTIRLWVTSDPGAARAWSESADAETRRRIDSELALADGGTSTR
jgi:hypothetical protein